MKVDATDSTSRADLRRAAATRRAIGVQRLDFVADPPGAGERGGPGRDAQAHLVRRRSGGRQRRAVQRVDADQVAADVIGGDAGRAPAVRATIRAASRARSTAPVPAYEICPSPMKPSR